MDHIIGQSKIISNSHAKFEVQNIKTGQYVAARVLFHNDNITKGGKASGINAINLVMQDEENIYHNIEKKQDFTKKIFVFAGILLIYWIILILLFEKDKNIP